MEALPHFIRDQATTSYYSTDWLLFLVLREVMPSGPSQDLGQLSIQDEREKYPSPVSSFEAAFQWGEKCLACMGTARQMGATLQPQRHK
eukprot:3385036-Amphidinium_carterae.1